jgi:uncharacterized membrane protein
MGILGLLHAISGLGALLVAMAIIALPKGSRVHRVLGWTYASLMAVGLVAILVHTRNAPPPFAGYAVFVIGLLLVAIAVSRYRARIAAWRAWHGALMSLTILGALMAFGSIVGGLAIGASSGPPFYRLFNVIIIAMTALGVVLIASMRVIWGRQPRPAEQIARIVFATLTIASSLALVLAQLPLASE